MSRISDEDLRVWREYIKNLHSLTSSEIFQITRSNKKVSDRLDVHGMTVQSAFMSFVEFIEENFLAGNKEIRVITGKSGQIRKEFLGWVENPKISPFIQKVTAENEGSFNIKLRKTK